MKSPCCRHEWHEEHDFWGGGGAGCPGWDEFGNKCDCHCHGRAKVADPKVEA